MNAARKISWLNNGFEAFPKMLATMDAAQRSIRLEMYIYGNDEIGHEFREALIRARQRGISVKVLIDAAGSFGLPGDFWKQFSDLGGEVRVFNPLTPRRFEFRNHRKMLVCDDSIAFIGGFNVADEYNGDGVNKGWRDLGLQISNSLVGELAATFDEMFANADFKHLRFRRPHGMPRKNIRSSQDGELLLSGPGQGRNPFKRYLRKDLAKAHDVKIICAYFLPTWQLRRELAGVVNRGGRVQIILAGMSDVFLSQMACRSLYRRLLKTGVEIYEYQPQVLHAKLVVIDQTVYAGSANLDTRSLHINFELMARFQNRTLATEARQLFEKDLTYSKKIELTAWRKTRTWWRALRNRWAYIILVHLDPVVARWQYRGMSN